MTKQLDFGRELDFGKEVVLGKEPNLGKELVLCNIIKLKTPREIDKEKRKVRTKIDKLKEAMKSIRRY